MKALTGRRGVARQFGWAAALFGLLAMVACGDTSGSDGNGPGPGVGTINKVAIIEITPNPAAAVVVSQTIGAGKESEHVVQIINTGDNTLRVSSLAFGYSGDASETVPAFRLDQVRAKCSAEANCAPKTWSLATDQVPTIDVRSAIQGTDVTGFDTIEAVIVFHHPGDAKPRSAQLTISSNADGAQTKVVTFATQTGAARMAVTPKEVDFKQVKSQQTAEKLIQISNVGSDALTIQKLEFTGSNYYTIEVDDDNDAATPGLVFEVSQDITFDPPVIIEQGKVNTVKVTFAPLTPDAATASLVVFSNDSTVPAGVEVLIKGNHVGACLKVNPKVVNFGAKGVGLLATLPVELVSCGTLPVEIYSIGLDAERTSEDFALDLTTLPGLEAGGEVTEQTPLIIPINQSVELNVRFAPGGENPKDEAGQPIPDLGYIMIANNSFEEQVEVEIRGVGVDIDCPQAVIAIDEGSEVIPQTVLHLKGDQSFAPSGPIAKWEWTVEQPIGSQSLFVPSATFPNPTFEANVAGSYLFKLSVWDENGTPSCVAAEAEVVVIPDEAIHVELLWNTPNDPDQTDEGPEAGADVDLHFLHPYASGPDLDGDGKPDGWFDQPFDCFWFNPNPNWGSFDPAVDDDPGLDRDDTDGAGPENLNLNIPENEKKYLVGVHYWHDHKYGPSYVTVRVYIYAELVFELTDVKLLNHDMWEVATIAWPSGEVTLITDKNGNYKITPNYENPFFFQP